MATYKLTPSSLTGYDEITNASNAYTDTDSSTYAEVEYFASAWLSGFDFSVIPSGESVSSIVVKCKVGNSIDAMSLYGTSSGTALSQTISLDAAVTVYTFTLTESASTIMQYSSTLGINFEPTSLGGYAEIYGAEIIVTTTDAPKTKTIRLAPSAYWQNASTLTISNIDNAYTNTDSDTYASIRNNNTGYTCYFGIGGFDFSLIPTGAVIDSVKYKISIKATAAESANLKLVSDYANSSPHSASSYVSMGNTTKATKEFTATEDFDTIRSYGSSFGINGLVYNGKGFDLYGAEIEVTYHINRNKIIYDGETLIDLTGDTVTAADVLNNKIFHLADGSTATGTATSASPSTATCPTITDSSSRAVTFSNLPKEPSWFIVLNDGVISGQGGVAIQRPFVSALYDGTDFVGVIGYSTSSSANVSVYYSPNFTFTYSSGTLTITGPSTVRVHNYSYTLYYL